MTIATGERLLASDINNLTFFPVGTILQFSGSEYTRLTSARTADNKVIWTLCNGTSVNGVAVPNLVGKFLRGAASSGTTGGTDSQDVTLGINNLPSHSHGVTGLTLPAFSLSGLSLTDLACAEGGSHGHTLSGGTASAGEHSHTVTVHDTTHDKTPSSTDYTVGEYGEYHSATYTTSSTGGHTHSFSSGSQAVATTAHTHTVTGNISGGTVTASGNITGSTDSAGSGTAFSVDTVPGYYTVVYIMKVA
jgi:hypothetical protein